MKPLTVSFTVDVEPDCPPYLRGFRGIEQGMPRLLAMLAEEGVPSTCFTTGEVAERFPGVVSAIVSQGHELACHGMTHRAFPDLTADEARHEIEQSAKVLRRFAPVTSFRAPYLRFPSEYVGILEANGFAVDSSQAKYKGSGQRAGGSAGHHAALAARRPLPAARISRITRVPASVTSSVLRLPRVIREAYLRALKSPVVLFVHPWEFVDLRRERLRIDCRFRTGDMALACVRDVLRTFRGRGARFLTIHDLATQTAA